MPSYIKIFLAGAVLTLGLAAALNLAVDPYWIYSSPLVAGLNSQKAGLAKNSRIFKWVGLARTRPAGIILGTSRSEFGLNPEHPGFRSIRVVNLAGALQPYVESRALLEFVAAEKPPDLAVIGLDFEAANALFQPPPGFTPEDRDVYRPWQLLIARSTLNQSLKTLLGRGVRQGDTWSAAGQHIYSPELIASEGGHHRLFENNEMSYLNDIFSARPACGFEFGKQESASPLAEFRGLLASAHRFHVHLQLVLSPSHARQWEALATAGLWDKWEHWKRELVRINEEEAVKAGESPFSLWDFSGYNGVTAEALPSREAFATPMKYYIDSSHYSSSAGDLMLDRVLGYPSPDRPAATDFGTRLTRGSIEGHLLRIRQERAGWRESHPDDVLEIESLARQVPACTGRPRIARHP